MAGMVTFPVNGRTATGYLALPKAGKGPGVVVLHAWWGLNDFFKTLCDRFAQAGCVAFAPDLYHGNGVAKTIDEADQLADSLDRDQARQDIKAAITYLLEQQATSGNTVGLVGFSLGGFLALSLEEAVPAVVTFYGVSAPEYVKVDAAFLGHFAEHDEFDGPETVQQLEEALRSGGKEVSFYTYPGTRHWFFEEDRPEYDAEAARLAWERTVTFLSQRLNM